MGILIALTVSDWNEQRKSRGEEAAILQGIKSSLLSDHKELSSNLETVKNATVKIAALCDILKNKPEYDESHDALFGAAYGLYITILNTAPYEALKSQGLDRISTIELRSKIIELFDQSYEWIVMSNEMEREINWNYLRPYYWEYFSDIKFRKHATPVDYQKVIEDASYQNMINFRLITLKGNQLKQYERALTQISELVEMINAELQD